MSQKMGLSAEAYQEWDAVMQHSGTSIESLQAGMKTLANAVENENEAFERLGMTQEQIAGMSNEDLFSATITALQNVENETERTYLAGQLLGRGATELGALLNTSAEDTQAMKDRVHELGGVLSNDAVKAAAGFQDSLQDMQTAFSGVGRNMMAEFLPSVTQVMDGIANLVTGDKSGLGLIEQGISNFTANLSELVPKMLEVGMGLLKSIGQGIIDNLPALADSATQILISLSEGIIQALPEIVSAGLSIILSLADGITSSLPELIPAAIEAILKIVEALTDPDTLMALVDAGIEIIIALVEGLVNAIPKLVESVPKIISNLVQALIMAAPKLWEAALKLIVELGKGLIKAIPEALKAVPKILGSLVSGFVKGLGAFLDIGKRIVEGIWEGIKSMASWIGDKVGGFFSGLVDGVKGLLGIHSPSKVFAGIGKNLALGLSEGWEGEYANVQKQIESGMNFDGTARIGVLAQRGGTASTAGGSGGINNWYVTINARDVKEFVDIVTLAQNQRRMQRMGAHG